MDMEVFMTEMQSRQDRKRQIIESIQRGDIAIIKLFPSELKRFRKLYPQHVFEVQGTTVMSNSYKTHNVKIYLK